MEFETKICRVAQFSAMQNPYESPKTTSDDGNADALRVRARTVFMIATVIVLAVNCALVACIPVSRFEDANSICVKIFFVINYVTLPIVWLFKATTGLPEYKEVRDLLDYFGLLGIGCVGATAWGVIASIVCLLYQRASKTDR